MSIGRYAKFFVPSHSLSEDEVRQSSLDSESVKLARVAQGADSKQSNTYSLYLLLLGWSQRDMFEKDVWSSYQDFVGKAAFCRNFTWDQAHDVAQGRYGLLPFGRSGHTTAGRSSDEPSGRRDKLSSQARVAHAPVLLCVSLIVSVWRGTDAKERGLVDVHGGVWRAVEVAKRLAKIEDK